MFKLANSFAAQMEKIIRYLKKPLGIAAKVPAGREYLLEPFNHKNQRHLYLSILVALFWLTVMVVTFASKDRSTFAQNAQAQSVKAQPVTEFISNEILVKVKKNIKSKVNEGKTDNTGIESLNKLNKDLKATKFERVAKVGKKSNGDADIFAWYKITLEGDKKILEDATSNINNVSPAQAIDQTGKVTTSNIDEKKRIYSSIASLKKLAEIETAEPNIIFRTAQTSGASSSATIVNSQTPIASNIPNDTYYQSKGSWGQSYDDLWGMKRIGMENAWNEATGSAQVTVAVIDTGVDRNHEDLAANMWTNTNEIPGNGIDDDGNGYVDDIYGWNFVNNTNDPMDDVGHGTHVAGTIGAAGNNNLGVVGVNWQTKIMNVKFMDSNGSGTNSGAISSIAYAADNGARVLSNSWGGNSSSAIDDAIDYAYSKGDVIVAAAGNNNIDAMNFSPAQNAQVITVSASDSSDAKAGFSNYGQKIDVAAPGVDILSTRSSLDKICGSNVVGSGSKYCRLDGTSMATPHVSGLAALILSKNPGLTNEEVRQILRKTATDLGSAGRDNYFGYGLINGSAVQNTSSPLVSYIASPRNNSLVSGTVSISGTSKGPNFSSWKLELVKPSATTLIANSNTSADNQVLGNVDTSLFDDGLNTIRLTTFDTNNNKSEFEIYIKTGALLTASLDLDGLISSGSDMALYGTVGAVTGVVFGGYTLDWGLVPNKGDIPAVWSNEGISLTDGGTHQVGGFNWSSILAKWDTKARTPGVYAIRMTANTSVGNQKQVVSYTQIGGSLGWPLTVGVQTGGVTQPIIADLNGDNENEIIIPTNRSIYVFRKDGSVYPGWPKNVQTNMANGSQIGVPVVADINGDGKKEVIVSVASSYFSTNPVRSRLFVFNADGTIYPGWPQEMGLGNNPTVPALGDVDGDGKLEIIYKDPASAGYPNKVFVFKQDGSLLPGWPKSLSNIYSNYGSVSLADLNKDGKQDIIATSYDQITVFDGLGNTFAGWPKPIYNTSSTPAVGDMNGDGEVEIFLKTATSTTPNSTLMTLWDKNGNILPGWPVTIVGERGDSGSSPAFFDLNGDGKSELLIPSLSKIEAYSFNGQKYTDFGSPPYGWYNSHPTIGKVTNNQDKILIAKHDPYTQNGGVYVLSNSGQVEWSQNLSDIQGSAVAADLDGDGKSEIFIRSGSFSSGIQKIYKYATQGISSINEIPWPQYQYDIKHSGNYINFGNMDSDNDGFTNKVESYVGTDLNKVCGLNAWPPDIDGDGTVTILDLNKMAQAYGAKVGDVKYNKRFDIDADGTISILDLSIAGKYFNSKCTNPVKSP